MENLLKKSKKKNKVIEIMTVDGKILKYRSPLKVHQALLKFPGHAISETLPVVRHLDPEADMVSGNLYYLLPPKTPVAETRRGANAAVRIKLVVRKQELEEMLSKGGVSLGNMISQLQNTRGGKGGDGDGDGDDRGRCRRGWRPVLESIPEVNDFY